MGAIADGRLTNQLFARWGPVVHVRDARSSGVPRGLLIRQLDRGELIRVGKASFARAADWDTIDDRERFRRRSIGFGLCLGDDAHLTGEAAAVLLDLPLVDGPTGLPVALRPGNAHTGHDRTPYGRVRHGYLPLHHRTIRARVRTVSPELCAVDVARHLGPRDGLAVADAVLRSGVPREALTDIAAHMLAYPGIDTVAWVARHADARAESPLESLGRYVFVSEGLAAPHSNVWIPVGSQWFRVDHLLADVGVVVEADGGVKYRNRPDADAIVTDEKERERLLRGAGFGVARYTWADATGRPGLLLHKVREAARLRNGLPVPTTWQFDPPWIGARINSHDVGLV